MKATQVTFSGVHGNLHTVFFMGWLKTAFDYPSQLNGVELAPWRKAQPVYGEIAQSHNVEFQA